MTKSSTGNVLDAEYRIYDQTTRALLTVREHVDVGPGVTEIEMLEEDERKEHRHGRSVSIDDRDLPLLIAALQRRYNDVRDDLEKDES